MTGKRIYKLILFWVVLPVVFCCQAAAQNDSLKIEGEEIAVENIHRDEKLHSPHKASFYAAILPGMGQIYNKKYWKLPLLYGGMAGIGYGIHFNSKYYKDYRRAYRDFIVLDPNNTSYEKFIPPGVSLEDIHGRYSSWFQNALNNKKRYYKRYRDMCYLGMGLLYAAQIIDAAVDAHFFNFDISDNLSMNLQPAMLYSQQGNSYPGMMINFNF